MVWFIPVLAVGVGAVICSVLSEQEEEAQQELRHQARHHVETFAEDLRRQRCREAYQRAVILHHILMDPSLPLDVRHALNLRQQAELDLLETLM